MKLPDLKYDFYDAKIYEAKLGPRREVTLTMELWPLTSDGQLKRTWTPGEGKFIAMRFGGINNYSEIEAAFYTWEHGNDRWEGLTYLAYDEDKNSKPGKLHFIMMFDRSGTKIRISCQNITITEIEGSLPS